MFGKIIIIKANGSYSITPFEGLDPIKQAQAKYKHIATEWDYSAQVGNPVNYYFSE